MHSDYSVRFTDIIDAVYERAQALERLSQPALADEARLFVYSQTAVAYAHLDRHDEKQAARLGEVRDIYAACYPKLMANRNVSFKQKLRFWLLYVSPPLHTVLFGKKMPLNLS